MSKYIAQYQSLELYSFIWIKCNILRNVYCSYGH
nr:MAG TPA: hypothetical protein [Caudoviricetes sp.]